MLLLALVPTTLIVALLVISLYLSLRTSVLDPALTLVNYVSLFGDPAAVDAALNTAVFSAIAVGVAMAFGVSVAWVVERTDLAGKSVIGALMTVGLIVPGLFTAMGWIFIGHPRIGALNTWARDAFGATDPVFAVTTVPGMAFVQGLTLAALVYVLVAANLRAMDTSLEESARMSGAGWFDVMRRVTLPLAWPGLLAAALYVLTIAVSAFDIPLVIGVSNRITLFSTYVYGKAFPVTGVPEYGISAAFGAFMIAFGILLGAIYTRMLGRARRYQVITGKGYGPRPVRLRRWAFLAWAFLGAYVLVAQGLPLLLVLFESFQPFTGPPTADSFRTLSTGNYGFIADQLGDPESTIRRSLQHTVVLILLAPALALALSLVISWVVLRTRARFRFALDFVAFLPHAVPPVIFALSASATALFILAPLGLYGSLALLVITLGLSQISFATRVTNSALIQISTELEEAAYVAGASTLAVLRRVLVPLLRPAVAFGFLWLALLAFRELTMASMLFSKDNITLSQETWALIRGGASTQAAALSIVQTAVLLPLVVVYLRYANARS